MKSQIKIVSFQGSQWISARSITNILSAYRDPSLQFSTWIGVRIKPFEEGVDYFVTMTQDGSLVGKEGKVASLKEILLTPSTAIEIALREKNNALADEISSMLGLPVVEKASIAQTPIEHTITNSAHEVVIQVLPFTEGAPMLTIGVVNSPKIGAAVSGRSLYNIIARDICKSPRDMFSDWVKERIEKYRYVESVDYIVLPKSYLVPGKPKKVINYLLSLKMAKQFATDQQMRRGLNLLYALKAFERGESNFSPTATPSVPELSLDTAATTDFRQSDEVAAIVEAEPIEAQNTASTVAPTNVESSPAAITLPSSQQISTPLPPAQMPTLVSRTRSQQLMEQQRQIQEELERTLREEEEQQKKESVSPTTPEQLADVVERLNLTDQRINAMEQWVRSFIGFVQQGATLLAGELPVGISDSSEVIAPVAMQPEDPFHAIDFSHESAYGEYVPNNSPRAQIDGLVKNYAQAKQHPYGDIWRHLYRQLNEVYHFNVSRGKQAKESYVEYVERSGQIDNLLAIAQSTLRPVASGAQA